MEDLALVATVPVSKGKALFSSGAKKGKLRPGCRFKGKRVFCTPEVANRLGKVASPKKKGRKGMKVIIPKSPQAAERQRVFQALLEARKYFKIARDSGDCAQMRHSGQKIVTALKYMGALPTKPTKKNPSADPRVRNRRYITEMDRVKAEIVTGCSTRIDPKVNAANRAQYEAWMASQQSRQPPLPGVSGMKRRGR